MPWSHRRRRFQQSTGTTTLLLSRASICSPTQVRGRGETRVVRVLDLGCRVGLGSGTRRVDGNPTGSRKNPYPVSTRRNNNGNTRTRQKPVGLPVR
eukprot:scaffold309276_cov19-Prasinocladus_malaysianus.AAC.1